MINKMNYKKVFWMNVVFAILWVLFCLLSFATDIDYVEHTLIYKLLSLLIQLLILTTSIVTAIRLFRPNKMSLGKVAILANYSSVAVLIAYFLTTLYFQPTKFISMDFLYLLLFYGFIITPFVINLKALRNNYD
jgi:hypothetical protein